MKRSKTTEDEWEAAVFAAESKEISGWVDSLREMNCNNIRIISCVDSDLPTTIISDSTSGDAFIITRDMLAEELSEAIVYSLLSEEITKIISDIYISTQKQK